MAAGVRSRVQSTSETPVWLSPPCGDRGGPTLLRGGEPLTLPRPAQSHPQIVPHLLPIFPQWERSRPRGQASLQPSAHPLLVEGSVISLSHPWGLQVWAPCKPDEGHLAEGSAATMTCPRGGQMGAPSGVGPPGKQVGAADQVEELRLRGLRSPALMFGGGEKLSPGTAPPSPGS
jgi:hypothetical protein